MKPPAMPKALSKAMASAPKAAGPKPKIKLRHIKLGGRSAFPAQPTAFGAPDQTAGPQAALGADPGAPAPGDAGE